VVGVVADIKGRTLGQEVRPQTYLTFAPGPFSGNPELTITIRSRLNAEELRVSLVDLMRGIDSDLPFGTIASMNERVTATLETERLLSVLLTVFAAIALLLGSLGVYGLMAYTVQRRRREIGLRLAIGADRAGVLGQVVRQGMKLGAIGVAVGVVGAVGTGRLLESLLFGVTGADIATLAVVSAAVLAVTALSSFGHALRAASVDPMTTLREE
jgi:ABC-type antimicrobial peptide transport system permease subunit